MARILFGFITLLLLCSAPAPASAEDKFPIVSANGFSCSQINEMVSCRGSFPGSSSQVLEANGYQVVWIRSDSGGQRYSFFSDSGCLCRSDFKPDGEVKTQDCTSRSGHQKTFKGGKSTYDWCKDN